MVVPYALPMLLTAFIACLTAAYVIGNLAKLLGWVLRRKTQLRRKLIVNRVNKELETYPSSRERSSPKSEDEEWEKVESHVRGRAKGILQGDEDWQGIIGFFHPFW